MGEDRRRERLYLAERDRFPPERMPCAGCGLDPGTNGQVLHRTFLAAILTGPIVTALARLIVAATSVLAEFVNVRLGSSSSPAFIRRIRSRHSASRAIVSAHRGSSEVRGA